MIYSIMHPGSGVGNQLHRFIAGKVLALDKGYEHRIIGRKYSKVNSFMKLDFGKESHIPFEVENGSGKIIFNERNLWEEKTNYYNPEFNFIEDNTIIDGEFQSEQYFRHRMKEIDKWLKVEPIDIPDDVCVIGFRGGEFTLFPELFLTKEYWAEAKILMLQKNINMKFEVHTDDPIEAQQFFPDYKIIHDVGINWRSMRCAKYAIIANSSFYILPRLLRHNDEPYDFVLEDAVTIAPRFWARRNIKEWSRPDNYYKSFKYI